MVLDKKTLKETVELLEQLEELYNRTLKDRSINILKKKTIKFLLNNIKKNKDKINQSIEVL